MEGYVYRNPLDRAHWNRTFAKVRATSAGAHRRAPIALWAPGEAARQRQAGGAVVVGLSGVGKTSFLKRVMGQLPQLICHGIYPGTGEEISVRMQVLYVFVTCPPKGTMVGLCWAFFGEMERITGINYTALYCKENIRIDKLVQAMGQVAHAHGLGVIILDEVGFLQQVRGTTRTEVLRFLLMLMNTVGVPIIFAGTPEVRSVITSTVQNGRRSTSDGFFELGRLADPLDREEFVAAFWERTYLRDMPSWSRMRRAQRGAILDLVDRSTASIQALVVGLFIRAQKLALALGQERITLEYLADAAGVFEPLADQLAKIRGGKDPDDPETFAEELPETLKRAVESGFGTGPHPVATVKRGPPRPARRPKERRPVPLPPTEEARRAGVAEFERDGSLFRP